MRTERKKSPEFKVPEDIKKLAKLDFKKFKKKNKGVFDSKKELKHAYYESMIDYVPEAIKCLVRFGHIPDMKEYKNSVYEKFADPSFVKMITKSVEKDDRIDNIDLFPIIIYDIISQANRQYELDKKENPETAAPFDLADLVELSKVIIKKKLKKLTKNGVPEALAFDVLSIIPCAVVLKFSRGYHVRKLFGVLYEHAKTETIPFEKIVKGVFNEDDYPLVISFAMLERRDKYTQFNDSQKAFFNAVSEWSFNTLEDMDKDTIYNVLKTYIEARKKDDGAGKDGQRRFYLSSLPEDSFPKITKTMQKIVGNDDSIKKYF